MKYNYIDALTSKLNDQYVHFIYIRFFMSLFFVSALYNGLRYFFFNDVFAIVIGLVLFNIISRCGFISLSY